MLLNLDAPCGLNALYRRRSGLPARVTEAITRYSPEPTKERRKSMVASFVTTIEKAASTTSISTCECNRKNQSRVESRIDLQHTPGIPVTCRIRINVDDEIPELAEEDSLQGLGEKV
jgi:hypothetical protein